MNQYVWYTNHSIYSDVNIYNHYLSLSYILILEKCSSPHETLSRHNLGCRHCCEVWPEIVAK